MNRVYLVVLFQLLFLAPLVSQTVYTSQGTGDWDVASTWNPGVPPQTPADLSNVIIRIQEGHTVTIKTDVVLAGALIVEIYGTLRLLKATSISGELNLLNANAIVRIAATGDLIAETEQGAGSVNSTWLTIGGNDAKLNGGRINELSSPNEITRSSIQGGSGGCTEMILAGFPCSYTPLPVELLYFHSKNVVQGIQLDWASAKEWDFSHYTLERSANGREYTPIHVEYVNGDSHTTKKYTYLDYQPQYGANYYRLKVTDLDGTEEHKGVVLTYSGTKGDLEVRPNPATAENISLRYLGASEGTWLRVLTSTGSEVTRLEMKTHDLRLPILQLPKGLYIVKVQNQFESKQARLIIH